jgi:hypothetical protein
MNKKCAMLILQWSLGLVVLIEASIFGFSQGAAHAFQHLSLPLWIRPVVAGAEIIAALLFLIPPTAVVGGWTLLGVLVSAILIHLLHGMYAVGSLVVFAAAALAVTIHRAGGNLDAR